MFLVKLNPVYIHTPFILYGMCMCGLSTLFVKSALWNMLPTLLLHLVDGYVHFLYWLKAHLFDCGFSVSDLCINYLTYLLM